MQHDTLLTVFVIVAAVAIVMQMLVMAGIYFALRDLRRDLDGIQAATKQRLDVLSLRVTEFVSVSREPVRNIAANLADISRTLRERTTQLDGVLADFLERSRLQIIRIDQLVSGLVDKAESTAGAVESVVEKKVVAPVQEVAAVIAGVRKGLEFLFARRRSAAVSETTQDEQMFI
jgi:hypothetical protein